MATARPKAILLARLSDNRDDVDLTDEGIPSGLDDQIRRMRERAAQLGWDVWKVIKNPRLSAYKRRKVTLPDGRREYRVVRPDLREALADLSAGRASALLCLDLDRAFRDPKDLQDLIDVVEHSAHAVVVESATGSLHMEKGRDNFDAEIRVLVANKASRDTARRVAAARERQRSTASTAGFVGRTDSVWERRRRRPGGRRRTWCARRTAGGTARRASPRSQRRRR
jgi:DNA invertase Pin-like site-specific DNA recombinase